MFSLAKTKPSVNKKSSKLSFNCDYTTKTKIAETKNRWEPKNSVITKTQNKRDKPLFGLQTDINFVRKHSFADIGER